MCKDRNLKKRSDKYFNNPDLQFWSALYTVYYKQSHEYAWLAEKIHQTIIWFVKIFHALILAVYLSFFRT